MVLGANVGITSVEIAAGTPAVSNTINTAAKTLTPTLASSEKVWFMEHRDSTCVELCMMVDI